MSSFQFSRSQFTKMIDHSILKQTLTQQDTIAGLEIALEYDVAAATIKSCYTKLAAKILNGTGVMINPVICFPNGYDTSLTKAIATKQAIDDGAGEIDMVLNLGALLGGEFDYVRDDISAVVEAAQGAPVKVILETGLIREMDTIVKACQICESAGASFVKTSTGFCDSPYKNKYGETVGYTSEILKLMRASVSDKVQVKAAQGVRRLEDALEVIAIGVSRFGVSQTVNLMREFDEYFK